jgi:hypothetical protein
VPARNHGSGEVHCCQDQRQRDADRSRERLLAAALDDYARVTRQDAGEVAPELDPAMLQLALTGATLAPVAIP